MIPKGIRQASLVLGVLSFFQCLNAQGTVFTLMAGPTMSTQTVNGFEKDPFFRFHGLLYIESSSELSPNSLYGRIGYHIKGSAVNTLSYKDSAGNEYDGQSSAMEFHNLCLSLGVKQRREVGKNYYSYGLGIRGDYNVKAEFDPYFAGLAGTQNKFTYGLNIDAGFEFPLSELVSTVIEVGFSPDFKEQIYIPYQDTGYQYENGQPVYIQETFLTNIVFEARIGFRLWRKVVYVN